MLSVRTLLPKTMNLTCVQAHGRRVHRIPPQFWAQQGRIQSKKKITQVNLRCWDHQSHTQPHSSHTKTSAATSGCSHPDSIGGKEGPKAKGIEHLLWPCWVGSSPVEAWVQRNWNRLVGKQAQNIDPNLQSRHHNRGGTASSSGIAAPARPEIHPYGPSMRQFHKSQRGAHTRTAKGTMCPSANAIPDK